MDKSQTETFDSDIKNILSVKECERFDRTRGGQDNIGKTIAGFGTKNGGLLLVGQDDLDKGGNIIGITESTFQTDFTHAIEHVKPAPLTRQRTIHYQDKIMVLIEVQDAGALRPCSYKGVYYERKGDAVLQLQPEEVRRYHLNYGSTNVEDRPSHATAKDIDDTELDTYTGLLKKKKDTILHTILSAKGALTVRGLIILARKPDEHLECAFIEIQRYDNFMGTPPIPIGLPLKISKPARQLIEEVANVVKQNLPAEMRYEGAKMTQAPAIPFSIIREVITNSVAHRNYQSHEHIRIRIYADGFDISNPAIITEKMWESIQLSHTTYHPNEGIYTFLNPALSFEGRGEGIWKIKQELQKLHKVAPEFKVIGEVPSTFYVRISISPAKTKDIKTQKLDSIISKQTEITATEVIKALKVSRVTAIKMLNKLLAQGIITHQGNARTSKYIINKRNKNEK